MVSVCRVCASTGSVLVRTPLKATAATIATSARSEADFQPAIALMRLFFKPVTSLEYKYICVFGVWPRGAGSSSGLARIVRAVADAVSASSVGPPARSAASAWRKAPDGSGPFPCAVVSFGETLAPHVSRAVAPCGTGARASFSGGKRPPLSVFHGADRMVRSLRIACPVVNLFCSRARPTEGPRARM